MGALIEDNSSLLATSQSQNNTFHPFPRLPTEIRITIFHYAALSLPPRTIELQYTPKRPFHPQAMSRTAEELAKTAQDRIKYPSSMARTPALFHVNYEARAVALGLYHPCKTAGFDVAFRWNPALAPYMKELIPSLGGSSFDPRKDTLFCGVMASLSISSNIELPKLHPSPAMSHVTLDRPRRFSKGGTQELPAVAYIESLAVRCNFFWSVDGEKYFVQFVKEFKSLRELILVAFEDCIPCDKSKQLGLEIRRREVILVDVKDLVQKMGENAVKSTIKLAQRWRDACAEAQARDEKGWKAPEILVKVARRGI